MDELSGRRPVLAVSFGRTTSGNGLLKAYAHRAGVTAIAGNSWDPAVQIGSGWNVYTLLD